MFFLTSDRLKLIPLSHNQLQLLTQNRTELDNILGLNPSEQVYDAAIVAEMVDAAENFWLPQTALHPQDYSWFTNWDIVLKERNVSIGGIGFTGLPDIDGKTMVGYGISLLHEGQGYASEALQCLLRWAFANPQLKSVIATTPPENFGSHRVLHKNNFKETGFSDDMIHWQLNRS
ncbi:GNAT family N-acetyltransferase [Adhaeribacter radiodurans]|uniref:GNAT family N-acetyltransferase n=1 Tax=Adhaeribacter radiodurans TaxID=2745197 RepID=A0A7L7LE70_9BACT|nr:GNAT family N-acetyltransferase [Adhaeribacter radiodurans]QMU31146.1 GNAT family N-acetyltransferase [Adhaeribacter radiodurans]